LERPRQLVLDLVHASSRARADFVEAPCNEEGLALLDRWPEWPAHAAAIVGPEGAGKSHLAAIWAERADAVILEAASVGDGEAGDRASRNVLIDDADGVTGQGERALFHLLNLAAEHGTYILLTLRKRPRSWTVALPDLASRLAALPVVEIGLPDEALIRAVMVKQFADRQLGVPMDVIDYLVPRMERTFAALRQIVDRVDRLALSEGRSVTRAVASRALDVDEAN
jgi:chromosomal replication initiation ATPase DnaA